MKIPRSIRRRLEPARVTVTVKLRRGMVSPATWAAIEELSQAIIEAARAGSVVLPFKVERHE